MTRFKKLESTFCDAQQVDFNESSEYENARVADENTNYMLVIFQDDIFMLELDYDGQIFPQTIFKKINRPEFANLDYPTTFEAVQSEIYYYFNNTLSQFRTMNGTYRGAGNEMFRFEADISSMAIDHHFNLLFVLDTDKNLFVIFLESNYLKLVAQNVSHFQYMPNHL
ncbi:hypothetical protein RF11_11023 [Thelohanellus kitauei]|uniref:Uncharacterized protein n=1 Tax=Thelohanellus kitauei TaxID=669202 RepID=A0A0C2NBL2_THEKT|nr:hypothetical protein RF11_11023 [Thelohanellus kitauei]